MLKRIMGPLQPIFSSSASLPVFFGEQDSRTDSAAETEKMDSLTLEFNSNPFRAFIKEIEYLIETNPQEAFRLLNMTLHDSTYDAKAQTETLRAKMDDVIDRLAEGPVSVPSGPPVPPTPQLPRPPRPPQPPLPPI